MQHSEHKTQQHMFSKEFGFFGGHGIVGAHIPLGAGIAFAEKFKGTKNVNICLMGDGAVRQGAFHEALNMAMTWKLPVVYVIENNMYAMGTSVERTSNVTDLYNDDYIKMLDLIKRQQVTFSKKRHLGVLLESI